MVSEGFGNGAELFAVHAVDFVVPARQIQPCFILVRLLVEYVCQVHGQVVSLLQFGIEFEDEVGPPVLRFSPFRCVFCKDIFCTDQQLLAGVFIG